MWLTAFIHLLCMRISFTLRFFVRFIVIFLKYLHVSKNSSTCFIFIWSTATQHSLNNCCLTLNSNICGNEMPTRCNWGFYCRSYCLLNMFWGPLCPSSGAQEYYTVVVSFGIWRCGFQVVGLVWSWGLHPANRTHNPWLNVFLTVHHELTIH